MVKKPNKAEDEPEVLKWSWFEENIEDTLNGMGSFAVSQLLEQRAATLDESDYLSDYIEENDPFYTPNMTLRVNTKGHGLYIFFNGELIASNYPCEYSLEVKPRLNHITLLSSVVGLPNYGPHYDAIPLGIDGVELVGKNEVVKSLSSNLWKYKVGLNGGKSEIYNSLPSQQLQWRSDAMPINRPFTGYKTTFKAPLGSEAVVVDMQGLGKGEAWVNGQSIGCYWPTYLSPSLGCEECDYRGAYGPSRCETNCGEPSQRWHHVPRSFLQTDDNSLVLFEEAGGNPTYLNFQTVTVGTACAKIEEGKTLELSCQGGRIISEVKFASFGDPQGTCGSFRKGSCESEDALVEKACVGQASCVVDVSEQSLGLSNCSGNAKRRLAVEAVR